MEGIKDTSKSPAGRGRGRGRGRGVLGMIDKHGNIKPAFQTSIRPAKLQPTANSPVAKVKEEIIQPINHPVHQPSPGRRFFNDVSPNRITEAETIKKKTNKKNTMKVDRKFDDATNQMEESPAPECHKQKASNRFCWIKEKPNASKQHRETPEDRQDDYHWVKPDAQKKSADNQQHTKQENTPDKYNWTKNNASDQQQSPENKHTQHYSKSPGNHRKESNYVHLKNPDTSENHNNTDQKNRPKKNDKYHWVKTETQKDKGECYWVSPNNSPPCDQYKKEKALSVQKKQDKEDKKTAWEKEKETWIAPENTVWSWYNRNYVDITPMNTVDESDTEPSPRVSESSIKKVFIEPKEQRSESVDSRDQSSPREGSQPNNEESRDKRQTAAIYGDDYTRSSDQYSTDGCGCENEREEFYGTDDHNEEEEEYQYDDDEESFSDGSNSDLSETGLKVQNSRRESIPIFVKDKTYISDEDQDDDSKKKHQTEEQMKSRGETLKKPKEEDVMHLTETYNDNRGKQNGRLFKDITTGGGPFVLPTKGHRHEVMRIERESSTPYKTTGRSNKTQWKSQPMIYNWKTNSTESVNQYGRARKSNNITNAPLSQRRITTRKYGVDYIDQESFPTLEAALDGKKNNGKPSPCNKNPAPKGGMSYSQMASKQQEQSRQCHSPANAATETHRTTSRMATVANSPQKTPAPRVIPKAEPEEHQYQEVPYQETKRSIKKKMKHQEVNQEYNSTFSFEQLAAQVRDCELQIIQATKEPNTGDQPIKTITVAELENRKNPPNEVKDDSPTQVDMLTEKEEDEERRTREESFRKVEGKDDGKFNELVSLLRFCFDGGCRPDVKSKSKKTKESKEVDLYKNWIQNDSLYHLASSIKTSPGYISNTLERKYPLWKTHWTPDKKVDQRFWNDWSIADEVDFTFPVFDCVSKIKPLHHCRSCRI